MGNRTHGQRDLGKWVSWLILKIEMRYLGGWGTWVMGHMIITSLICMDLYKNFTAHRY